MMRNLYEFCPNDATTLIAVKGRPTCSKCGFVDYKNPKPAVGVLIEQDGRVLLGRPKSATGCKWDILGGFIEAGETAEQAAIREIREEAGLELTDLRYFMSQSDTYPPFDEPTVNIIFVSGARGYPERPGSDVAEIRRFLPHELPQDVAYPHQSNVLNAWQDAKQKQLDEKIRERFLEEYRQCQAGYQYRDQLTQDEFVKMFIIFNILALLLGFTTFFGSINEVTLVWIRTALCITGGIGLLAILVDLEANASCKGALRARSVELEGLLGLGYWSRIRDRSMRGEEWITKKLLGVIENLWPWRKEKVTEGSITAAFVWVGRFLLGIWLAASVMAVRLGGELVFR
jgi:ADP-ribose pyrophosphatase YjhB (NUDIX family)